jgi:hypothetical protein
MGYDGGTLDVAIIPLGGIGMTLVFRNTQCEVPQCATVLL